jgi:MOSC domain-containing protein YiiM
MSRLLSANVGLPRDVTWNGKTVRTAVWKSPVTGRRMVRKRDIDGDDLAGHGEHRAVFVCQMDSYHYWERFLGRSDFAFGQFEKTSPSRDFLITRCASAIDTASVVLNLHA